MDRIPVYVRAGSILPLGPEVEYAGQKPDAPIELRIYRGANGQFTVYEDQGDTYAYEHGAFATIPISWDEASSTLTIGARTGTYPGMPSQLKFRAILVGTNHGSGPEVAAKADREIAYSGQEVKVKLP
jgi:alpha-D-xyloside xylohydrolase